MKAKLIAVLRETKNVISYVCILSLVLEILLLSLFGNVAAENPGGILDSINTILAFTFFISLFIVVLPIFPEERNPCIVHSKIKPSKGKWEWSFTFRGKRYPLRIPLFLLLGFLAGIYFVLSFIFFDKIADINQRVRIVLFLFGIFYPLASLLIFFIKEYIIVNTFNILLDIFEIKPEREENEIEAVHEGVEGGLNMGFDVLLYYIGGFAGWIFCMLIIAIILIPIIIYQAIKGIIWLVNNPNPWGILAGGVLLLILLIIFIYRKYIEFEDFLFSLSSFPDFKI